MFAIVLMIMAPGLFCYLVLPDQIAGLKMVAFCAVLSIPAAVFGVVLFLRERREPSRVAGLVRLRMAAEDYDDDSEVKAASPGFFDIDDQVKAANVSWAQRQHDERLRIRAPLW